MINATFVGQAEGDIRQKLQKLEFFISQDQEAKKEANRKMKKENRPPCSSPCWTGRWAPQQANPGRDKDRGNP
jgi:hypothetical protein